MFVKVTVLAYKSAISDSDVKKLQPIEIRYALNTIKRYHKNGDYGACAIIYVLDRDKDALMTHYYVKETPEELDALVDGADAKAAKILYGKT